MKKKKTKQSWLDRALGLRPQDEPLQDKGKSVIFQPALRRIGVVNCPICKRETAVYLTRTRRPFVNCGFCSARIFYNGAESIRLLKKKMEPVEE